MLIRAAVLEKIAAGEVSLAFRRWKKPTVKTGGRLRTAIGELAIHDVSIVASEGLTEADARAAGFASLERLRAELAGEGVLYRISLSYAGADARVALREETAFDEKAIAVICGKLRRIDDRLGMPGWSRRTLSMIGDNPGRRAQELAVLAGMEKPAFKIEIRRLKALGLTESLETGYRLSPRGRRLLGLD